MSDKYRYNLTDHLTKKEVDKLLDLFNKIKLDLSDNSFPTRTNRLERKLDEYNHTMELIRTIIPIAILCLQVVILVKLI